LLALLHQFLCGPRLILYALCGGGRFFLLRLGMVNLRASTKSPLVALDGIAGTNGGEGFVKV
jgi:hypothetical protein